MIGWVSDVLRRGSAGAREAGTRGVSMAAERSQLRSAQEVESVTEGGEGRKGVWASVRRAARKGVLSYNHQAFASAHTAWRAWSCL